MKYELEPENRNCPDEVLVNDLSAVAKRLGKSTLTKEEYNKHGRFCAATMQNRFGSWVKAVMTAGLAVTPGWKPRASDDELFSNLAAVWEKVGRQPKKSDFKPPDSRFSDAAYFRRFGSWRKALEAFVGAMNDDEPHSVRSESLEAETSASSPSQTGRHRTPRAPGWRLIFLVQRRDRFTCRACGRTPALEPGLVLQLDHILAWSKGGETTYENLQTLCKRCNIGKGTLSMNGDGG